MKSRITFLSMILCALVMSGCSPQKRTSQAHASKHSSVEAGKLNANGSPTKPQELALFDTPNLHSFPSTFSIVGRDPKTGEIGIAVQSKFFGVGPVVPWLSLESGAIATQSYANTKFGPEGLRLLAEGKTADETLKQLLKSDPQRELRQVGIVDSKGGSATFTGSRCHAWAGGKHGPNYAVQGNILVSEKTVLDMEKAFLSNPDAPLGERLMSALEAGQAAGGDARGKQSAALRVLKKGAGYGKNDRWVWLTVDDHPNPIRELRRLYDMKMRKGPLSKAYRSWRQGSVEEARQYFKESMALTPNDPSPFLQAAEFERRQKNSQAMEKLIVEALKKQPDYDNLYFQVGLLYLRAGKKVEALRALKKTLELNAEYKEVFQREQKKNPALWEGIKF